MVEYLSCGKVLEVLGVREHLYLLHRTLAIPSPMFERIDDGKEFLVMDLVVYLRRRKLARVEGNRVQAVVLVSLGKDRTEREIRRSCLDDHRPFWIEVSQNRRRRESLFELVECSFGFGRPFPVLCLTLRELRQGTGNPRIVLDEASVKVCEAQKALDLTEGGGVLPLKPPPLSQGTFWYHLWR